MKRRPVDVLVSDHAVLRWLEREHGIDVDAVKCHIRGLAENGAELGAVAVQVSKIKLVISAIHHGEESGEARTVMTALDRSMRLSRKTFRGRSGKSGHG